MAGGDPTDDARHRRAGPFAKAGKRFKSCGERKLVDVVSNAEPHCFNRVFFDFCPRFSKILWEIVRSIVLGLANGGALVQVSTTCHNEPHVRGYRYNYNQLHIYIYIHIIYIYIHMHTCYLVSVPTKPNYPGWWTQLVDPSHTKDEPVDSFYPVGLTTAETLHGYFILIFQLKGSVFKDGKKYNLSLITTFSVVGIMFLCFWGLLFVFHKNHPYKPHLSRYPSSKSMAALCVPGCQCHQSNWVNFIIVRKHYPLVICYIPIENGHL